MRKVCGSRAKAGPGDQLEEGDSDVPLVIIKQELAKDPDEDGHPEELGQREEEEELHHSTAISVKQQQCEAEDLVIPIPAPVASSLSSSAFVTSVADGHHVSSLSLAVASGELREIPGMGTFIETSHHDGTITRYPITAAIPVEEHPISQPLPPSSTMETITHHQLPMLPAFNRFLLSPEEAAAAMAEREREGGGAPEQVGSAAVVVQMQPALMAREGTSPTPIHLQTITECSALNGTGDDENVPPPPTSPPTSSTEGTAATIDLSAVAESTIGVAATSDSMSKVYTTLESVQDQHNIVEGGGQPQQQQHLQSPASAAAAASWAMAYNAAAAAAISPYDTGGAGAVYHHHHHHHPAAVTAAGHQQEEIIAAYAAQPQHSQHHTAHRYHSPTDGGGEPLVLPPPPQPPAGAESHCILIQRMPQRHRKTRGTRGANKIDDKVERELFKKKACHRERDRMKAMNCTFQLLRARLPSCQRPSGKRLSKIESLRLAVKYIKHMQYLMAIPPNQNIPQHIVEFDPGVPSWRKNPQVPGDVLPLPDFEMDTDAMWNTGPVGRNSTAAAHAGHVVQFDF